MSEIKERKQMLADAGRSTFSLVGVRGCKLMSSPWKPQWTHLKVKKKKKKNIYHMTQLYHSVFSYRETCSFMSIADLFTITRIQKWPRCPSVDKSIINV